MVDFHQVAAHKENLPPTREGRNLTKASQSVVEEVIDLTDEPDEAPPDRFDRALRRLKTCLPSERMVLVQEFIDKFKDDSIFQQDIRFFRLCMHYGHACDFTGAMFTYMYDWKIASSIPAFWISWANYLETTNEVAEAFNVAVSGAEHCLSLKHIKLAHDIYRRNPETEFTLEMKRRFDSIKNKVYERTKAQKRHFPESDEALSAAAKTPTEAGTTTPASAQQAAPSQPSRRPGPVTGQPPTKKLAVYCGSEASPERLVSSTSAKPHIPQARTQKAENAEVRQKLVATSAAHSAAPMRMQIYTGDGDGDSPPTSSGDPQGAKRCHAAIQLMKWRLFRMSRPFSTVTRPLHPIGSRIPPPVQPAHALRHDMYAPHLGVTEPIAVAQFGASGNTEVLKMPKGP